MPGRRYTKRNTDTGEVFSFYWDKPGDPTQDDIKHIYEDQLVNKAKLEAAKRESERPDPWWLKPLETVSSYAKKLNPVNINPETGMPTFKGGLFDIGPELERIHYGIGETLMPAAEALQKVVPWKTDPITPEIRKRVTGHPDRRSEPVARGLRDVVGGALDLAARPVLPIALATAPIPTLGALAVTGAAHPMIEGGAKAMGLPPETAGLTADVLSLAAGGMGAYREDWCNTNTNNSTTSIGTTNTTTYN
jgi:hypothetical protein